MSNEVLVISSSNPCFIKHMLLKLSTDELREALRPIASLISKSEKAQQKLVPGTWQHSMLRDNLKALTLRFR